MTSEKIIYSGLSSEEAKNRQQQYGKNRLTAQKKQNFFQKVLHVLSEPMFLLLIAAAIIYFLLGEPRDGLIMLVFVLGVISIDVIQEWKTDKTLSALRELSAPHCKLLRDGTEQVIPSEDLVPGDVMIICEGVKIPADGRVLECSDLCVDESSLTGESVGVWKMPESEPQPGEYWRKDFCYAGTLVTQGSGLILVEQIGAFTEYGKIGQHVAAAPEQPTPLQKQTRKLVKYCAMIAAVLFLLVGICTWFNLPGMAPLQRFVQSILSGITLAMAMIPEEFPVILTVFLSMGAWRLAKKHSLVRRLPSVETLGAITVLCVDKTGTITQNRMTVQQVWCLNDKSEALIEIMGLGCETNAYDPMEQAMLSYCRQYGISDEHLFQGDLITEYPFTNEQKIMGHVWRHDGQLIIAAKGSPERLLPLCHLSAGQQQQANAILEEMSGRGLRVIAVACAYPQSEDDIPAELADCSLTFCGLIGLADPPREGVKEDIQLCRKAGIRVVMITGDNGATAASIAKQVGMPENGEVLTGDMLDQLSEEELREHVKKVSIFSRVVPEHKMRIVKAFQQNGEIVAMTGDGVNDAPALKYADIGIAMGGRGSEVSREAADLILLDDNFSTIVDTVRDGRRIYDNIRKAVGYVFSIHIPIALSSLLAPMLGVNPASLFLLPLHVVLLELIIDPTCSIVLERQPAEPNIMQRPPRKPDETLLNPQILFKSILQGLAIFAASFASYYLLLGQSAELARSMGLAVLMLSNLFLVLENSLENSFVFQSFRLLANDRVMWLVALGTIGGLLIILYTPLAGFLRLAPLPALQLLNAFAVAALSVFWYELVKLIKRKRSR